MQPQLHVLLGDHLRTMYHNNHYYVLYIIYYRTHGMKLWFYPSNIGHGHIFQMLKLQSRSALKDHFMSDPLF